MKPAGFRVRIDPGGREILASPGEDVLTAALAAGVALPHSCRAGRCATCKARLVAGDIDYPGGKLPPGIVASEAAKGEVLLCQARPRSDLHVIARVPGASTAKPRAAVSAAEIAAIPTGGQRVTLEFVGIARVTVRPGQFVDVEAADDTRERVAVVAVGGSSIDIELHELSAAQVVKVSGPYDTPR